MGHKLVNDKDPVVSFEQMNLKLEMDHSHMEGRLHGIFACEAVAVPRHISGTGGHVFCAHGRMEYG